MNARKEASIFSGFRHGALWSAVYNIPSSWYTHRVFKKYIYSHKKPIRLSLCNEFRKGGTLLYWTERTYRNLGLAIKFSP